MRLFVRVLVAVALGLIVLSVLGFLLHVVVVAAVVAAAVAGVAAAIKLIGRRQPALAGRDLRPRM